MNVRSDTTKKKGQRSQRAYGSGWWFGTCRTAPRRGRRDELRGASLGKASSRRFAPCRELWCFRNGQSLPGTRQPDHPHATAWCL